MDFENWRQQMAIGENLLTQGRFQEARNVFDGAVKIAETFGFSVSLAKSLHKLGTAEWMLANSQAAIEAFDRSLRMFESVVSPVHVDLADCLTTMGRVLLLYDLDEAESFLTRAMSIYRELDSIEEVAVARVVAKLLRMQDKHSECTSMLTELRKRFAAKESQPMALAAVLCEMAMHRMHNNCHDDAILDLQESLELLDKTRISDDDVEAGKTMINLRLQASYQLADAYYDTRNYLASKKALENAISIETVIPELDVGTLQNAYALIARLHMMLDGDFDSAEELIAAGASIWHKNDGPYLAHGLRFAAQTLAICGRCAPYEEICRSTFVRLANFGPRQDGSVQSVIALQMHEAAELMRIFNRQKKWYETIEQGK